MANEENLTPWEKGTSGNPKGKPKGAQNRSTIAKKWLSELFYKEDPLTGESTELTVEDLITLAQVKKAVDGQDTNAYKAIMDSAYGAPKQEVEQKITERKTPKIRYIKSKDKNNKK